MCYLDSSRWDARGRIHHDKCCNVEIVKICYIFAIFNVVIVCLCWLGCFGTWGFLMTKFVTVVWIEGQVSQFLPSWALTYLIYAFATVVITMSGVFAVLLLQGVRKKKPELVKAYLFFGLIVEWVMIMGFTIYISVTFLNRRKFGQDSAFLFGVFALALCVCVIYGFILCLVRNTHLILSRNKTQNMEGQTVLRLQVLEDYIT